MFSPASGIAVLRHAATFEVIMKKTDILIPLAVILVSLAGFAAFKLNSGSAEEVLVTVNGHEVERYDLSSEVDTVIEGAAGFNNRLVIHNGKASIVSANCPDGICVKSGEIKEDGEVIVCLPNRVVVEIIDAHAH